MYPKTTMVQNGCIKSVKFSDNCIIFNANLTPNDSNNHFVVATHYLKGCLNPKFEYFLELKIILKQ